MVSGLLMWLGCAPSSVTLGLDDTSVDTEDSTIEESDSDDTKTAPEDTESGESGRPFEPDPTLEPSPYADLDGDGWSEAAGDCDPERADVYPGAREWCDERDHDCDGQSLAPGVCAELQDVERIEAHAMYGDRKDYYLGWKVIPPRDFDADGIDDVIVRGDGVMRLMSGYSLLRQDHGDAATTAWWEQTAGRGDSLQGYATAGDFNGDGYQDFWISSMGLHGSTGTAYLIAGPPSSWPAVGTTYFDGAAGSWLEPEVDIGFGSGVGGDGDVNGDGLDDVVISQVGYCPYYEYYEDPVPCGTGGGVWVVYGTGDLPVEGGLDDAVFLSSNNQATSGSDSLHPKIWPDIDGDGLAEVLVNTTLIAGADLEGADGMWYRDVGVAFAGDLAGAIGDWNGDGAPDIACAMAPSDGSDRGAIAIVTAPPLTVGTVYPEDLWIGGYEGDGDRSELGAVSFEVGDMDADGQGDLSVLNIAIDEDHEQGRCILVSSQFVVGATQVVPDAGLCIVSGVDRYDPGDGPYAGDFNGDGRVDLLYADPNGYTQENDDRDGILHITLGWDLPWNDPTYW